jgi:serine/threonine-protein phosphatase PPG1
MAPFDLDACIQQLLRKQLLHEAVLREICTKTKEVLMRESNVVHVSAPVTVVGDIHGSVTSADECLCSETFKASFTTS